LINFSYAVSIESDPMNTLAAEWLRIVSLRIAMLAQDRSGSDTVVARKSHKRTFVVSSLTAENSDT
jgi:hypothetical protein